MGDIFGRIARNSSDKEYYIDDIDDIGDEEIVLNLKNRKFYDDVIDDYEDYDDVGEEEMDEDYISDDDLIEEDFEDYEEYEEDFEELNDYDTEDIDFDEDKTPEDIERNIDTEIDDDYYDFIDEEDNEMIEDVDSDILLADNSNTITIEYGMTTNDLENFLVNNYYSDLPVYIQIQNEGENIIVPLKKVVVNSDGMYLIAQK